MAENLKGLKFETSEGNLKVVEQENGDFYVYNKNTNHRIGTIDYYGGEFQPCDTMSSLYRSHFRGLIEAMNRIEKDHE